MLQALARMLRFDDLVTRESRGNGSVAALMAIARGLATVDGRKTLLYFSEGLDVPPAVDEVYRTMVSAANRSNLSIYSFDARGLRVKSPNTEAHLATELAAVQSGSPTSGRRSEDAILTALDAVRLNRQATLRDLAESTGGFLVAETNDLRPGLDRVAADLRSYYELAYAPPNPRADGRWRTIEVKVARPGVSIRTRKGYYAFPPGAPIVRPSELPLYTALETKPLPRQVELRGAVLRLVDDDPAPEALVLVEVPLTAAALQRDEAAGLWRARLRAAGAREGREGGARRAPQSRRLRSRGPSRTWRRRSRAR